MLHHSNESWWAYHVYGLGLSLGEHFADVWKYISSLLRFKSATFWNKSTLAQERTINLYDYKHGADIPPIIFVSLKHSLRSIFTTLESTQLVFPMPRCGLRNRFVNFNASKRTIDPGRRSLQLYKRSMATINFTRNYC